MSRQAEETFFSPFKGVDAPVSRGRKILYYTDARHFGGHEVASLRALEWMLLSGARVCFISRSTNHALNGRLLELKERHSSLETLRIGVPPLKYPDLAPWLYRKFLRRLRSSFEEAAPDWVFVSQGNPVISWAGLYVARALKIPCLSYIPMAQPLPELLGVKGYPRAVFSRQIIRWPDAWLTCTNAQKKQLRRAGAIQPIEILPNPISIPCLRGREQARAANRIPPDAKVIGMAGRLNNRQKGCDLLFIFSVPCRYWPRRK